MEGSPFANRLANSGLYTALFIARANTFAAATSADRITCA